MSVGAASFLTVTASTKRNQDLGSGRTGSPVTYLASLAITPLWPVSPETVNELALNSPREYKECYHVPSSGTTLPDVKEGDVLVVGSTEYPVSYVGEWTDGSIPTLHIVVQEVKT